MDRPAAAPISACRSRFHEEVGRLLKSVLGDVSRKAVSLPIGLDRCELDDWIQREYTATGLPWNGSRQSTITNLMARGLARCRPNIASATSKPYSVLNRYWSNIIQSARRSAGVLRRLDAAIIALVN